MSTVNKSGRAEEELERLLTKQHLHELIAAFSRAADRLDGAAMAALFHPDALIDSGVLRGDPEYFASEFVRWVRANARLLFHAVSNQWFKVDGEQAIGETYVTALARLRGASGESDVLTVGRYLDRFERREHVWKFTERRFVLDHSTVLAANLVPLPERELPEPGRGAFAPHDPVFGFWAGR
jgi:SnoaL-like domain